MAESRNKAYESPAKENRYPSAATNRIVYPHHTIKSSTSEWRRSSEPSTYGSLSADDFNYETTLNCGFVLKVYKASITRLNQGVERNVEAIVNAANEDMDHAGGVAKVIANAAGQAMNSESKCYVKTHGPLGVSQNIVTTAGTLPYRAVVHAVGPMWKNYRDKVACLDDLYDCVYNVLTRCKKNRYRSVAMTAIGAGVFAVPKQLCADMYVFAAANFSSIRRSTDCPKELHIVDIDTSILRLVEESVKRWKKDPESLNQRITLPVFLKDNPHLANDSKRTTTDQSRNDEQDKNFEGDRKREGSLDLANTIRKLKDESFSWGGIAKQYMLNDQFVVKIYQGDICKVKDMDAVVCGVDKDLKLSGKFADTMRKHGGHIYDKNHQKMVERQKNGPAVQYFDVYKCDGGRLEAKHVLHAVLKGVVEADVKETKAYQDCMASVLATVKENRWEKVAIPLIRTGAIQTNKRKLKLCGQALVKALDEFIVINGDKVGVKEIHLVNYTQEVNIALVDVFNAASDQVSAGNELGKRNTHTASGRHMRNGYFRRHSTRGRVSHPSRSHSYSSTYSEKGRRVESQKDEGSRGSKYPSYGFSKRETYGRYDEKTTGNSGDVSQGASGRTRNVVYDREYDESQDVSGDEEDQASLANNTRRLEGNLTIIDG